MKEKVAVGEDPKVERGNGAVVSKPGSAKLYYDFYYLGHRVEISTRLDNTKENYKKARKWLDRQMGKIEDGTFSFADAFPGASQRKLEFFSLLEGKTYAEKPQRLTFGEYVKTWEAKVLSTYAHTKKVDYKSALNFHLLPHFRDMTFFKINRQELKIFVTGLRHRDGIKKGEPLSRKRIENILIPLRTIWDDACDEHRWELPDPFRNVHKHFPDQGAQEIHDDDEGLESEPLELMNSKREPLRFDDFAKIVSKLDPWYKPVAELMALTGLIASELAGVTKAHIKDGRIYIRRSVSRGVEKKGGKNKYRRRDIIITAAIEERLNLLLSRTDSRRLVITKRGKLFHHTAFYKAWVKAEKAAGVHHHDPYALRHTFAGWSLTLRIDPNRVANLMGHANKKMVYEKYGNYVEGLEEDRQKILEFFGKDFLPSEMQKAA